VPGQVFYNATRRMVLKGADCIVFVADSQEAMLDANLESLENLRQNLEANELDPNEIPLVLQYNKRDLPNALPIEILNERLNPRGVPFYEAVAIKGQGVEETLKGVTQLVFRSLAAKYGGADAPASRPAAAPPPKPAAPPPPPPPPPPPAPPPPSRPNIVMEVSTDDSLLDSLELQPAPDLAVEPLEIEALEIDLPEPAPPAPRPQEAAKTTLVSAPREAEEMRRKISRPSVPDLTLEELGEDDDDEFDELSLPAPAVAAPPEPPPPPRPEPPPAPRHEPPPRPEPAPPRPAAPRPGVVTIPPMAAGPISTPPVSVALPAGGPSTDVTIPVEVRVGEGEAQVAIHIRLTLSLKLER
jgi:hypothetical protein